MRGWFFASSCLVAGVLLTGCGGGGGAAGTIPAESPSNIGAGAAPASTSSHTIYFTSSGLQGIQPSFFAYSSSASGSEQPLNTIVNSTALGISGLATDAQGNIYASYLTGASGATLFSKIIEYSPTGSPIRTIGGDNTNLQTISNIAVAPDGTIYVLESAAPVGCPGLPHLLAFAPGSSGNVAPTRDITGSYTDLPQGGGGALTAGPDGSAYVSNIVSSSTTKDVGKIDVYGPSQTGNVHPQAIIQGGNTQIGFVYALAASPNGLYVDSRIDSTQEQGTIVTFPFDANGNVAPSKVLNLPEIGFQLASDSAGNYYLYLGSRTAVEIFAADASGNASPIGSFRPTLPQFSGCNTCGFTGPMAVH